MGELVQSDGPDARLYRLGWLAEELDARGHEVVRWIPTFIHTSKSQRYGCDTVSQITDRYQIRHIYARGYSKHIGIGRIRFHFQIARRWERLQRELPAADLILTSMPTAEICSAARRISKRRGMPFVVDVRDLWPDGLYARAPGWVSALARLLIIPMRLSIHRSLSAAAAITGVSESYVEWGVKQARRSVRPSDREFTLAYSPPKLAADDATRAAAKWRGLVPPGAFLCVFLGTLNRGFNLSTVIEAARLLSVTKPGQFEWVICGDGPTRGQLEREAADLSNVRFPGWIDAAEVSALLSMASVGLAPYDERALQSLPNKPFEYAGAGIPVVSSLVGELSTLLDKHGFGTSYRSGEARHLVEIIARYADDDVLRKSHGKAGRELWENEHSPNAVYPAFAEYLEDVARHSSNIHLEQIKTQDMVTRSPS